LTENNDVRVIFPKNTTHFGYFEDKSYMEATFTAVKSKDRNFKSNNVVFLMYRGQSIIIFDSDNLLTYLAVDGRQPQLALSPCGTHILLRRKPGRWSKQ
jgi:hypothetical protein